jgi:hypothetical protein
VHAVLRDVLGLDRLEGAGADVQRASSAASRPSSKCSAAVGAATAPGFFANTVW